MVKISLIRLILYSVFLLSPHVYFVYSFPENFNYVPFVLFIFLLFIFKYKDLNKKINLNDVLVLLLLLALTLAIFQIKYLELTLLIKGLFILVTVYLIYIYKDALIELKIFIKNYNRIIVFLVFIPLILIINDILLYFYLLDKNHLLFLDKLINMTAYEDYRLKSDNLKIFHFDQWINFQDPSHNIRRFNGHLVQGSLIPINIVMLFGIALVLRLISFKTSFLIFIFLIFSFSSSVYFIVFPAIILIVFYKWFKSLSFYLPIALLIVFFIFSIFIHNLCGLDAFCSNGIIYGDLSNNNVFIRYGSGLQRINLVGYQIYEFLSNPITGPITFEQKTGNKLGSFILSVSLQSGIIGLIISVTLFINIFKKLCNQNTENFSQKFGFMIIYFSLLQGFIYQDFGYNSINGFAALALLIITLEYNKKSLTHLELKNFKR